MRIVIFSCAIFFDLLRSLLRQLVFIIFGQEKSWTVDLPSSEQRVLTLKKKI